MALTLLKKEFPYPHWEYKSIDSGDSLRIVPERGGLITSWMWGKREMLYFDQIRFEEPSKKSCKAKIFSLNLISL